MSDPLPAAEAAARPDAAPHGAAEHPVTAGTLIAVLGVVYGDIGTSPLYALKASLLHFAADGIDRAEVLGVLSMVFWSLVLVVTVKYVLLVLRAHNRGEGGIMALTALAQRHLADDRHRRVAAAVGIAGAGIVNFARRSAEARNLATAGAWGAAEKLPSMGRPRRKIAEIHSG